jgi:hypothetical protein
MPTPPPRRPRVEKERKGDAKKKAKPVTRTAPAATVAASAPTTAAQSARAVIDETLEAFGLGALGGWAWEQYLNGVPTSKIMLDLRARPEYKARFAGIAALSAKGRAISEQEYISQEQSYASAMRAYGLPASFYDGPEDFGKLIAGEVSAKELDDRLSMAQQVISTDPRGQQLRSELGRLYGLSNADGLTLAYWIDPDKGADLIKKQYVAAQSAATSQRVGFGSLTQAQAEMVGQSGVSDVEGTFGQLATMGEFTQALPGTNDSVTQDDLLNASFGGNADARKKVQKVADTRTAQFRSGGGFAASGQGVTGLGSST